jgi:hypothetical protein
MNSNIAGLKSSKTKSFIDVINIRVNLYELHVEQVGLSNDDFGLYHITYPATNQFGSSEIEFYIDIFRIGLSVALEDI